MSDADPVKPPEPRRPRRKLPFVLAGVLALAVAVFVTLPYLVHRRGHNCGQVEPTEGLDKIRSGARHFFESERYDSQGNLLPKRFPRSVPPTPSKPNCEKAVTANARWGMPGWQELRFAITEPHYYSFEFHSAGTGSASVFTARARGDLDCDGVLSTFELRGSIDAEGVVKVAGPILWNEIE